MSPGTNAVRKRSPTLTPIWSPSTIRTIEGGMICPSVPAAEITPRLSFSSYPLRSITGSDMRPIAVTLAPTTPVAAASSAPTKITPTARPPRNRPNRTPIVSRSCSASLLFSSTVPMKIKNGTASRTWFDIVPNVRSGRA